MTATIRPSLILNMDVDERQYSDDLIAEVKRSYSYVAPSVVAPVTSADAEAPVENTIRLVVRMHRPYWDANDTVACEQWDAVMPKWLKNMFYKVSSTVTACNDVRRKAGQEPLPYAWMEVEFGDNLTVAQATEAGSAFPSDALSVVEKARDLACAGVLGEGAVRLSVPSCASWEAQRAAALEAAQTEDDSLADGACESAGEAAEAAESVEPVESIESVEAVEPADAVDDAAAIEGEPAAAKPEAAAPDEASKIVFAPPSKSIAPCGASNTPTAPCALSTARKVRSSIRLRFWGCSAATSVAPPD